MKGTAATKEEKRNGELTTRREPLFQSLQQEMNRLFEDFKHGLSFPQRPWFEPITEYNAKIDVKDNDKEIVVTAEIPGVDMKDIDVSLRDDGLVIKGEKREEKEENEKGYYRMERSYGSFYRFIPMPNQLDPSKVTATYKNGVVKVVLPKTAETAKTEKKVDVKAG